MMSSTHRTQLEESKTQPSQQIETSEEVSSCPQAQKIIDMAGLLGIDATREFHLLAIAKHAVESPQEWMKVVKGDATARPEQRADLAWFRKLVDTERARCEQQPTEVSPWLKLTEPDGTTYYFNFRTHKHSDTLPRSLTDNEFSKVELSDFEVMRFTSWWVQAGQKRYVHINYYLSAEEFEVVVDKEDKVYRLKDVQGRSGPAGCWDLHINATLKLFGRTTTLMQCNADTRNWIESNAKRLMKIRDELEKKLRKYETVNRPSAPAVPLVQVHLRPLMQEINNLKTRLAKHRPSVAAQLG